MRFKNPGYTAVAPSMTPKAPFSKRRAVTGNILDLDSFMRLYSFDRSHEVSEEIGGMDGLIH